MATVDVARGAAPVGARRTWTLALIGVLALAAWAALGAWSASPYARFLSHDGWSDLGPLAELCRTIPEASLVVPALLQAIVWLLMITAMTLPTTLPPVGTFSRITANRPDASALHARAIAGYVLAWMGFGLVAYALDFGVHAAFRTSGWLVAHGWIVGATVLAGAGAFQFSTLKYRCLERCSTPFGFVNARWRGRHPAREAFRIGFDHGAFCVGCCWALMLVMFVVGMGNFGAMLALAALMAAEKNLPWGRRLAAPIGIGFLAWAAVLVSMHV